ncbi:MAG: methyltransferase domain-containing protein [Pyrinomonadaceae bacterium]
MNLVDLLRRRDRAVTILSGETEPGEWKGPHGTERVVRFRDNASLRLTSAHEFSVLKGFPRSIDWAVVGEGRKSGGLIVEIVDAAAAGKKKILAQIDAANGESRSNVMFDWPVWAGSRDGFHLELRQSRGASTTLSIGPLLNPRRHVLPLMKGCGVEEGPGLTPHILPARDIDVRYVEALSAEEWIKLYKKTDKPPRAVTDNLWANYVVGSAQTLDVCEDGSLDFIYSNHVFEHLVNPIGVLENWLRKINPSGVIGGVIPDLRYTFDLRQPASTIEEFLRERLRGSYNMEQAKYVRWCRYTAPYNTPEDLVARKYSIHVHYYTPDRFADLISIVREEGAIASAFVDTAPNNKDFGFLMWKRGSNLGN